MRGNQNRPEAWRDDLTTLLSKELHLSGLQGRDASPQIRRPTAELSEEYEAVFDRAAQRLGCWLSSLDSERHEALRLHSRLLALPPAHRRLVVLNVPSDRAWSLANLLIDRGHGWALTDCEESFRHAELATLVASRLSIQHYGRSLVAEIKARAWACLGNASRIAGHLGRADEAFQCARAHLAEGSGEPLEEGLILDLEASLHATRGRLPRASWILDRAAALFHVVRDPHLVARARLKQGILIAMQGDWQMAREQITTALERMEAGRDPCTAAVGQALLAALRRRCDSGLQALAGARADLRTAKGLLTLPSAWPAKSLVHRVEQEVYETWPTQPVGSERFFSVWPWWL